jgi:hypothetical protein
MTVIRTGTHIYITFPGGRVKLYAKTADTFYGKGSGSATNEFVKNNTGKINRYNVSEGKTITFYKKVD